MRENNENISKHVRIGMRREIENSDFKNSEYLYYSLA